VVATEHHSILSDVVALFFLTHRTHYFGDFDTIVIVETGIDVPKRISPHKRRQIGVSPFDPLFAARRPVCESVSSHSSGIGSFGRSTTTRHGAPLGSLREPLGGVPSRGA